MRHSHTKRTAKSSSGKVLIELLLVTPLLLMIPAGVMEYARFLRMDQIAAVFSQEAANRAYRQCADFYVNVSADGNTWSSVFSPSETARLTLNCLTNVRNSTNGSLQTYLPGSQIILSVYRYNFDVTRPATDTVTSVAVVPNQPSADMFNKTLVGLDGNNKSLVRLPPRGGELISATQAKQRERIVVAEVTFKYLPVLSIFRAFFDTISLTTNGEFRETTVL